MKGNAQVLELLNEALIDELMAINQYMLHSEMFALWGYGKLGEFETKLSREEMKHAELLIERILFLEGMPGMTELKKLNIGTDAPQMVGSDLKLEMGAVDVYTRLIDCADRFKDNVTFKLAQAIITDEERHVRMQESEQKQIKDMGIDNYLSSKV